MKRTLALVVAVAVLAVPLTAAAATPKPWQWTPTKVVKRLQAASPIPPNDTGSDILAATCRGTGKGVVGRFSRFTCQTRWGSTNGSYESVLTIRILALGSGKLCVVTTTDFRAVPHVAGTTGTRIEPARACP